MKAITMWQPWATLYVLPNGPKLHETRGWKLKIDERAGTWLAIHAAKRPIRPNGLDPALVRLCNEFFGSKWGLPLGAIVGKVRVDAVIPTETIDTLAQDRICGNFEPGRYGWRAAEKDMFPNAIPWLGRQSLFSIPDSVMVQS